MYVVDGKQICSPQTSRHIEVCPSISLIDYYQEIRLLIVTLEFFTSFFETKQKLQITIITTATAVAISRRK